VLLQVFLSREGALESARKGVRDGARDAVENIHRGLLSKFVHIRKSPRIGPKFAMQPSVQIVGKIVDKLPWFDLR